MILAEPDATERFRFSGFLPSADFLAQLKMGLGKAAFSRGQYSDAERIFRALADEYPKAESAPEAVYWAGVSAYKADGNPSHLRETGIALRDKYPQSDWAKKGSVWVS